MTRRPSNPGRGTRPAFTLTELLVVMGIIAVIGVITALAVRAVARDAKLSSGKNTIMSVLDNARALAIRDSQTVMVVLRPKMVGSTQQAVDLILAEWAGDMTDAGSGVFYDRFVPITDVKVRTIPVGLKVAGPYYRDPPDGAGPPLDGVYCGRSVDLIWITQTHLPAGAAEAGGELIGVMFGPDGTSMTRNSANDSSGAWVDFDDDQLVSATNTDNWEYANPADETLVNVVPFIAVYDDDEAREVFDPTTWGDPCARTNEISDYINEFADRIHFNRYSGVAMR